MMYQRNGKKIGAMLLWVMILSGCANQGMQEQTSEPKSKIGLTISPAIGIDNWPGMKNKMVRKYTLTPALQAFNKTKRFKFKKPGQGATPGTFYLRIDLNGRLKVGELYMEVRFKQGEAYYISAKIELHGLSNVKVYENLEKLSDQMARALISDMRNAGV